MDGVSSIQFFGDFLNLFNFAKPLSGVVVMLVAIQVARTRSTGRDMAL